MAPDINTLPNEMLCQILDFLDSKDKFRLMRVSKRWKTQIEDNVRFYDVILTDENYETARDRFGQRRVSSMSINNYSRREIPFTNLSSLRELTVGGSVRDHALTALFTNAVHLEKVSVVAHHNCKTPTESLLNSDNNQQAFPSVLNIKRLDVHYEIGHHWKTPRRFGPWNTALYYAMPNVEELYLNSYTLQKQGLDFFMLLASKPKLHTLHMLQRVLTPILPALRNSSPKKIQPLTKEIYSALAQVRLTRLKCNILNDAMHIRAWEIIFSSQTHLQELVICNNRNDEQGFKISIISPVLIKCSHTLSSIDLSIDATLNSTVDIQIFSNLKVLRSLKLGVCNAEIFTIKKLRSCFRVTTVKNISTIITKQLVCLQLRGFEFSEEDVINAILAESKRDLFMVIIDTKLFSTWKRFEGRLPEMGITPCTIGTYFILYQCITSGFKHNDPKDRRNKKGLVINSEYIHLTVK